MYVNLTQKLVWAHTVKKNHAIPEEWIWIDTEKEVYNSSYVSTANELVTCTTSNSNELHDDCKGGKSNEGEEE